MEEKLSKKKVLELIAEGKFDEAEKHLKEILREVVHDEEVECALKVVTGWKIREEKISRKFEKGIISQNFEAFADAYLKEFKEFLKNPLLKDCLEHKNVLYKLKYYVYSVAAYFFKKAVEEGVTELDLVLKLFWTYREVAKYREALEVLTSVWEKDRYNSFILALLGDVTEEMGLQKRSRLYFREAFFWSPMEVSLEVLKSPTIKHLAKLVENSKHPPETVKLWIPVYGAITNTFNSFRMLRDEEVRTIRNRLETALDTYKMHRTQRELLKPVIINTYLWLIDYELYQNRSVRTAHKYLMAIKNVDRKIFAQLVKGVYPSLDL